VLGFDENERLIARALCVVVVGVMNSVTRGYPNLYPMPLDTVPATYKKPVVVAPEGDIQARTPWLQAIGQKHGKDLSTGYIIVQPFSRRPHSLVSLCQS
jgi:hypothetical protein